MSCTFESAFQRQLFIKMFSGTYNQDVTTDVQSVRGERVILQSFMSCDLFLTSVFELALAKPFFFPPCYVLDQIVCYEDSFKSIYDNIVIHSAH